MKTFCFIGLFGLLMATTCRAQQVIYANLKELAQQKGDTLTLLKIEKRTKNQLMLTGGGDYRISIDENNGMSRYLKSRCYAVLADSNLYINCKKVRYKRFSFGSWYAPAIWVNGKIYFAAQPVGSIAASTLTPEKAARLGGEVGEALASAGLVHARVYYEITPETGVVEFVGKEKMTELLKEQPQLVESYLSEGNEGAEVTSKYLLQLRQKE
ncbi:MAG: hypothetical protein LBM62_01040 [Mediterranea sp.]|jgi:hypothetical protein|nr:hypothetical protein [Mediterranea sp.]